MVKSTEFWGGLFWLAFGGFVLSQGLSLGFGRVNDPGAGFAFVWLGIFLLCLAGIVLVSAFREPGVPLTSLWAETRWPRVLVVVGLLLAYGYLFETIGFVLGGTIMMFVLMTFVDPVGLWRAALLSLIVPYGSWRVLSKWLLIQLPNGILAPWLG